MPQLRFSTLVEAPLTVAFDVARALGRPWGRPLVEVESERPFRDVYAAGPRRGQGRLTHTRRFTPTAAGTVVDEQLDWESALLGGLADRLWLRRRAARAMRAHLDAYAAAAARRALDVVQVVGVALVEGDRVLVAQRADGPFAGCWEFPGGKVEAGESDLEGLVRECREELGVEVAPQAFLGEVPLDGVVGGGAPGASTLRVWWGRVAAGVVTPHEHTELRWLRSEELDGLDWIAADRPLLPAVAGLLDRLAAG
ncbi:(deoxy)nucleoside triphosphate pyrophosphohydrolase [Blastococcus sp. TF02A-26]|uniref:(deoxy)nucleoside triphosphate pyrophosphohydrolase n=1 Tax=Blastococcus sp. TF02A-26 TaxID=2250577 RepID=UPI000DEB240A|nr:(deoxy)nucleoside triphosphate pyrophosphohydrolase [Blastococcus sp. TF02A-26]RBY85316.1 NUDIX hydrolase [Blastococcus sp. TF02A-26]